MKRQMIIAIGLILAVRIIWGGEGLANNLSVGSSLALTSVSAARAQTLVGTGVLTTTTQIVTASDTSDDTRYTIFFPLVLRNFCEDDFDYNETISYNLSVIQAAEVWYCYRGQDVVVAVVDTGVYRDHPDLATNMLNGKTFVSGTSSPEDDHGHGTHVAGIVAGVGNNGGIIGVAPNARIMPVKVLNYAGSGTTYDVANGIIWASDNGAQIINLSLGTVSYSSSLAAAVDYAYDNGVLLIAAGGNCGDSSYSYNGCIYQDQPQYPAALSNVVAVASTTSSNRQSSFSNEGSYIEVAAPGSSIYSTYLYDGYITMSGTSQATPHAVGVAALIWGQNPDWSNEQVRTRMRDTVQDLGSSGWDRQFGYGLVNAADALEVQQTSALNITERTLTASTSTNVDGAYVPGEVILKLQTDVSVNDVVNRLGITSADIRVMDTIPGMGIQRIVVAEGQEKELLEQFKASAGVEFAELNYIVSIQ
jgi:type VII secretion-associated serine protease mycosin